MAAVALIVFDQGGPGPAGEALEGTVAGGLVTVTNDVDTDVLSWSIELVDVPPDSALVPGVLATADSGTPSATFTPDVDGSYRTILDVFDATGLGGVQDRDIRNFGIRNGRGIIVPPYQKLPDPLPLLGSGLPGEKPDEQNYGGQTRGWAGDRSSGQMEQFMAEHGDLPFQFIISTPHTIVRNETPLLFVDLGVAGSNVNLDLPALTGSFVPRTGQRFHVFVRESAVPYVCTVTAPFGGSIQTNYTTWTLRPGTGATFLYEVGEYQVIDARLDRYERSVVASAEDTDLTGFQSIGATYLDPADFPNIRDVTWQAIVETTNAADAAEIRLYNVTTAAVVATTTLSTAALVPTLVSVGGVVLASGPNLYEAQLRLVTTGTPNRATCKQAQLILEWFQ